MKNKMAAQWSENIVSVDFADLQASAMAVDCLGSWAVLAGRRAVALVDLDNPNDGCHRMARQSRWDISCVQWNPHASHAHLFCTTSDQRLDLFSWKDENSTPVCSMKGHSRHISDVDWSTFDVNVIASCSVDSYTHLWDVRDPKRPSASFQTVAGASQVKWNRVTSNCFATTHEGDVRIWDPRKGNTPVLYMAAHLSKVHGMDWSPTNEYMFATASQDCTVKFWEYTNRHNNKGMINSGSPVWRARFTPFGNGLVTVLLSTLRRTENNVYLWNNDNLIGPVHQFVGHTDVVLQYQWRKKDETNKDYHLVTWSKDQSLRIWRVDPQLQRLCGHDTQDSSENEYSSMDLVEDAIPIRAPAFSTSVNSEKSDVSDASYRQQPMTLSQEFLLVNKYIPNVTIEQMDAGQRTCTVSVVSGKYSVCLSINFPDNYPNAAAPNFTIRESSTVTQGMSKKLLKVLKETSHKNVQRNINCLEPCLRQFATAFENMTLEERKTPDSDVFPLPAAGNTLQHTLLQMSGPIVAYQDASIPFPRTCGASFCSTGQLVCFGRPKEANKGLSGSEVTPKALSELVMYTTPSRVRPSQSSSGFSTLFPRSPPTQKAGPPVSVSTYYMPRERPRSRTTSKFQVEKNEHRESEKAHKIGNKKTFKLDPVRVYDVSRLLPIHKHLAENYIINLEDISKMCKHNANAALAVGRKDLFRLWSVVAVINNPLLQPNMDPDVEPPWGKHPFGRQTLETLFDHYSKIYDVQTLAMLCCVFWNRQQIVPQEIKRCTSKTSLEFMPANTHKKELQNVRKMKLRRATVDATDAAVMKVKRSNSWSYEDFSLDDYKFNEDNDPQEKAAETEKKLHENYCRMLNPSNYPQYDQYMRTYADILRRWGLRMQCTQILKYVTIPTEQNFSIEFRVECQHKKRDKRDIKCGNCKSPGLQCAICHTGVKGLSNFCLWCGHGGHTNHMRAWFTTETECPTGCGCHCLKEKPFI